MRRVILLGLFAFVAVPLFGQVGPLPGSGVMWQPPGGLGVAFDGFNEPPGPLSGNWTYNPNFEFNNATMYVTNGYAVLNTNTVIAQDAYYYWNVTPFTSNQWVSLQILDNPWWSGVLARCTSSNMYVGAADFGGTETRVYEVETNSEDAMATFDHAWSWEPNDYIGTQVVGVNPARIYVLRNGVPMLEYEDFVHTNVTAGQPGFGQLTQSNAWRVDNWSAGNLTLPTASADNFQRPNGLLGYNWATALQGPSIVGGGCLMISNSNVVSAVFNDVANEGTVASFGLWGYPISANHYSQAYISSAEGAGDWVGVVVRGSLDPNVLAYLAIVYNPSGGQMNNTFIFAISAYSESGYNLLTSTTSVTWLPGDQIRLEATGNNPVNLTFLRNGTPVLTCSDSTYNYSGAYAGLAIFQSSNPAMTNWSAGPL